VVVVRACGRWGWSPVVRVGYGERRLCSVINSGVFIVLRFSIGLLEQPESVQKVGRGMKLRHSSRDCVGHSGGRGRFSSFAILSAGLVGLQMMSGCSAAKTDRMLQYEPVASDRMATQADMTMPAPVGSLADATIGKAIEAHALGDVEQGVALFVAAAESGDFQALQLNPMTESEFAAEYMRLPLGDREAMHEAILDQVMQARYLVNDVFHAGDQALESGEESVALRYYQAVRAFGQVNREQPVMLIVKITAEAIEAGAEARLARLDLP
jgi:hypothetical protein